MALAPLPITSTAPSAPSGGSDLLSNSTTSIGWPSTPPAALISPTASFAPAIVSASIGANQPLDDITNPKTGLSAAHPVVPAGRAASAEMREPFPAANPTFLSRGGAPPCFPPPATERHSMGKYFKLKGFSAPSDPEIAMLHVG